MMPRSMALVAVAQMIVALLLAGATNLAAAAGCGSGEYPWICLFSCVHARCHSSMLLVQQSSITQRCRGSRKRINS